MLINAQKLADDEIASLSLPTCTTGSSVNYTPGWEKIVPRNVM